MNDNNNIQDNNSAQNTEASSTKILGENSFHVNEIGHDKTNDK